MRRIFCITITFGYDFNGPQFKSFWESHFLLLLLLRKVAPDIKQSKWPNIFSSPGNKFSSPSWRWSPKRASSWPLCLSSRADAGTASTSHPRRLFDLNFDLCCSRLLWQFEPLCWFGSNLATLTLCFVFETKRLFKIQQNVVFLFNSRSASMTKTQKTRKLSKSKDPLIIRNTSKSI